MVFLAAVAVAVDVITLCKRHHQFRPEPAHVFLLACAEHKACAASADVVLVHASQTLAQTQLETHCWRDQLSCEGLFESWDKDASEKVAEVEVVAR